MFPNNMTKAYHVTMICMSKELETIEIKFFTIVGQTTVYHSPTINQEVSIYSHPAV